MIDNRPGKSEATRKYPTRNKGILCQKSNSKGANCLTPEKRNAATNPSVGADVGQQFVSEHSNTITDRPAESNENFEQGWKKAREFFRRVNDPAYLPTVTME